MRCASVFALIENLCYTVVAFKSSASKRGFRDRFLVSDPLGAFYVYLAGWPNSLAARGP
jgi:RPA family protein